jgi:hypothetical protein
MMRTPIVDGGLTRLLVLGSDGVLGFLGLPLGELAVSLCGWLAFRLATGLGRSLGLGSISRSRALLEAVLQLKLALLEVFDLGHEGKVVLFSGGDLSHSPWSFMSSALPSAKRMRTLGSYVMAPSSCASFFILTYLVNSVLGTAL